MAPYREVILKAGPAPKPASNSPNNSGASSLDATVMPPHTAKKRSPKKTDGPMLSGTRISSKSPAKSKKTTPQKRKVNAGYDGFAADDDEESVKEEPQKLEEPNTRIVGIDLGMWGHGRGRAALDKDPSLVTADLNWKGSDLNQFKSPSVVAFKKDNPTHPQFRKIKDHLVGFNVTPDMVSCSFFKASLDQRAQPTKFDNPILEEPIAKSLVSFSDPTQDEQAAIAVLKYIYDQELENASAFQMNFEDRTLENTKFIFVLTHPAACSLAGRQKLEALAEAAGLGSRHGDKIKLLSEAQAALMASFISYKTEVKNAVWQIYFKEKEWITVLDIGSLTVDTTTEEVFKNDPKVELREKIVSEGGRCGTVTLHLQLLEFIRAKFDLVETDLPQTLVGRGTAFHNECEKILRAFTGNEDDTASTLRLKLPDSIEHEDYDPTYEEITLHIEEIKAVFDEWLAYPAKVMVDQWVKSKEKGQKVKTTIVCGGGSLLPYAWTTIVNVCRMHGVKAIRPENPIAAVCRGAIISQLSDRLLGQRLLRAHFGIKLLVNGEVVMHWILKRGDIIDTTKPNGNLRSVAGHFTLNQDEVINRAGGVRLEIFTYDRDDKNIIDPDDPGIEKIADITIDKSNMSLNFQNKLARELRHMDNEGRKKANLDGEVCLGVDESGRLYFEAKSGRCSLGKEFLRYDTTRNFQ